MKTYNELGHVYRTQPCVEYPGEWVVYAGEYAGSHESFEAACADARLHDEASVCWACSGDDPRVGQVWFTGFYCAARFSFGRAR